MQKTILLFLFLVITSFSFGQSLSLSLSAAVKKLEADPQMKHALLAFHVVESATGKAVFSRNIETGLSVASSQKVFTAAAAFDLLGKDFRYHTSLRLSSDVVVNGITEAALIVSGSGDPTFGSWRYKLTTDSVILNKWVAAVKAKGIKEIKGGIKIYDQDNLSSLASPIPEGYPWQDIGNYYGAGTSLTNWHENQYDVEFRTGATGEPASILEVIPDPGFKLNNLVRAGKAGSGDNAYIFAAPYSNDGYISGTVPPHTNRFTISGSFPDPAFALAVAFRKALIKNGIRVDTSITTSHSSGILATDKTTGVELSGTKHFSPTLDSIVYYFLRKSINLYGEALVKTFSNQQNGNYEMDAGIEVVRNFWFKQGIEKSAFNVTDGSGLSPSNRVTVSSLVRVMQYARSRPWFNLFYDALPEFNGIKMKSGTINGVKSFTGYIKSKSNKEYSFAIVINNYDGSSSQVVQKMYNILDILK